MESKRSVLLAGVLVGVFFASAVFFGGDIYKRFAWDGHQTFEVMIANDLFKQGIVESKDIKMLTHRFGEALRWTMSRALPMKNGANLKKLGVLLDEFLKYDQEYYTRWLEERRSEEGKKKFTY